MTDDIFKTYDLYLKKVDLIDYYITKNITKLVENKESFNFILDNIFLLSVVNKSNKNSLIILLENKKYDIIKKIIKTNNDILKFKNYNENTLFNILLQHPYFYDIIVEIIKDFRYSLVIYLIKNKNNKKQNFIDLICILLNEHNDFFNNDYLKIINIFNAILDLNCEKKVLLITTLCTQIKNDDLLEDILKKIIRKDTQLYSDQYLLNGVDYLLLKGFEKSLNFIVKNIKKIIFCNFENPFILTYVKNNKFTQEKLNLVFHIIEKSNINKFVDNDGKNILQLILTNNKIDTKLLKKYSSLFNIKKIENYNKHNKHNTNNIKKISLKSILKQAELIVFPSNPLSNMLYTLYILKKYKNVTIPYKIKTKQELKETDLLINLSNIDNVVMSYLKTYGTNYKFFLPHIIIWKDKNNYFLDKYIIEFIKNNSGSKNKRFILIKLSFVLLRNTDVRHANYLIVDNKKRIVERFEPYGNIEVENSIQLNKIIEKKICSKIEYKFVFSQLYPGFQIKSDELNSINRHIGDPSGYCLAWCYLYIEVKLMFEEDITSKIIENYVNKDFKKEFNQISDNTNKYLYFIRYYSKYLDNEKNLLLKKFGLNEFYKKILSKKETEIAIKNINKNLLKNVE